MIQAIIFAASVFAHPVNYQNQNQNSGYVPADTPHYPKNQNSANQQQYIPDNTRNNGDSQKYVAPNPSVPAASRPTQPLIAPAAPVPTNVQTQSNPNGAASHAISGLMTVLFVMASM